VETDSQTAAKLSTPGEDFTDLSQILNAKSWEQFASQSRKPSPNKAAANQ